MGLIKDVGDTLTYEVRGRVAIITLNQPEKLNALNGEQYLQLAKYVEQADREEGTILTLIQSTGRYFSAGANIADKGISNSDYDMADLFSREYWLDKFVSRNVYLADLFHNHTKILAAAVNGPAIGLSAALLALCDLIYVKEEAKFFLLAPFANLGLVAEGAASATLFLRLGWSKASEALLLAKPISGRDLNNLGFINKTYDGQFKTTEEFNTHVHDELVQAFSHLHEQSILENKQLLKANRDTLINSATTRELVKGLNKWVEGVPQQRFSSLHQKEIKHKL
ncbi:ClpP/crotonase [Suhomyces tanzawaensis NRRL Y-17324]|uniref:ClpP/crotonase n=1 Tax=Suhomyces tanzawaensis NRRL Y-17324 TaxID=984487 RepID=A0A1E4SNW6_9ASCO|nr:ClpP/crotonase [Suhomyces tanzawaensis NRRL Y-17324]ODV81186.1 ClpP/crotonase [Suhomyces tanzawaensis NRRL Y-17324]